MGTILTAFRRRFISRQAFGLRVILISAIFTALFSSAPVSASTPSAPAQSLPPMSLPAGFADQVVVSGLGAPRAFEFAPDGRMFILQLGSPASADINFGSVRVFKNGALLPAAALTLNICGDGERGLLGIALDPNFTSNGYLYLYYTRQSTSGAPCAYNTFVNNQPGPRNRVSRFSMTGDTIDPASEVVLIDNIATDSGIHNAGDLHFGADGHLYVSVGDSNIQPSPAQNLSSLNGKILRILPTPGPAGGYTTAGNPFDASAGAWYCGSNPPGTGTGPCREVFAYGFRNPFRFSIEPGTSTPFVGDVGGGVWEEIDDVVSGGNYGYPMREGPCPGGVLCTLPQPPSGYNDPIYAYPHQVLYANLDSAVIGGPFYTGAGYPAGYQDNLFFADYVQGWIKRLVYDNVSGQWNALNFGTGANSIIGLRIGPDTDLYYLSFASSTQAINEIHRIHYQLGVNQPPAAQLSASPSGGPVNTVFAFSAAGSIDPDGNLPLTYNWDFGDGTTLSASTALTATKTYTSAGPKVVTLTVTDSGVPPATSLPVTVTVHPGDNPPTATLAVSNVTQPGRNLYYAGDTWSFSVASATDDHPLPANAFSWDVVFHHRTHTHPFLSGIPGSSGQFTIPTSGETDPVVWYRVILHVTDSVGQVTDVYQDVNPTLVQINLGTNPAGGSVTMEGLTYLTPYSATRAVGIQTSLDVPSPQLIGGSYYGFSSWSNGGTQFQVQSVPVGGASYTANLSTVIPPTSTPTSAPPSFPTTPILDNFNRPDGVLGPNWAGLTSGYAVKTNQMTVSTGWDVYWAPALLGANQEVYATLSNVDVNASEIDLLLKAQTLGYVGAGILEASYDPVGHTVSLWTYTASGGWVQSGGNLSVTLVNGDQLGARALADGSVTLYRNGAPLGTFNVASWPYYNQGGYIGLWTINATNAAIDDFGGGNAAAGSAPTATGLPPTATKTTLPPTATNTALPPTATNTALPPTATNTALPPTATNTALPPTATNTALPPTATNTVLPPTATNTALPPTATNTALPPTATNTAQPPTATNTALPPTATNTAQPPTATNTALPPTATNTPAGGILLVGANTVGSLTDDNPAGVAEAFVYTASASGSLKRLSMYIDSSNTATQVILGLYSNTASNTPGSLLTSATMTSPLQGSWNSVAVPAVNVTAGTRYWIALLTPAGMGTIKFRDVPVGSTSQISAQANLTALPATWSPGTSYSNSPLSAYGQ